MALAIFERGLQAPSVLMELSSGLSQAPAMTTCTDMQGISSYRRTEVEARRLRIRTWSNFTPDPHTGHLKFVDIS